MDSRSPRYKFYPKTEKGNHGLAGKSGHIFNAGLLVRRKEKGPVAECKICGRSLFVPVLRKMKNQGFGIRKIDVAMNRSPSTISREIERNKMLRVRIVQVSPRPDTVIAGSIAGKSDTAA